MENLLDHLFGQPWGITEFVGVTVLVSVVGGLLIGAVAVVTSYFRDRQRDEMDATLKMEMIQRGMSAEEITTVLKATGASFDPPSWAAEDSGKSCRAARRAMRESMRTRNSHQQA
jgi:hypothetical protein